MNAVEKLEAAIAKLEELRDASTKPTGAASWYQGQDRKRYEGSREVYSGPDENAPGSQDIVRFAEPEDAELVVVLHRTIEPQLVILREARDLFNERLDLRAEMSDEWRAEHHPDPAQLWPADIQPLAIADAILGAPNADVG